jgi:hypothetical protein
MRKDSPGLAMSSYLKTQINRNPWQGALYPPCLSFELRRKVFENHEHSLNSPAAN